PDRAIPLLARRLASPARALAASRTPVVLHLSGASGAAMLDPLARAGWSVGALHPLMTFPPAAAALRVRPVARARRTVPATDRAEGSPGAVFRGTAFAVDGGGRAGAAARSLIRPLGGWSVAVPDRRRTGWHLAACLASNYVVTLLAEAAALMSREAELLPRRALAALLPLLRQTVANLESAGLPAALTGPVARGDAETIARHAALLAGRRHSLAALHAALVERTVALARAGGMLDRSRARRILAAVSLRGTAAPAGRSSARSAAPPARRSERIRHGA